MPDSKGNVTDSAPSNDAKKRLDECALPAGEERSRIVHAAARERVSNYEAAMDARRRGGPIKRALTGIAECIDRAVDVKKPRFRPLPTPRTVSRQEIER